MPVDQPRHESLLGKSIGAAVRRRRSQMGMGAAVLARASGLSPGMLSRIERGLISPSLTSLQALAHALHVPLGSLFSSFDDSRPAIFTRAGRGLAIAEHNQRKGQCELLGMGTDGADIVKPQIILITTGGEKYPELPTIGVLFLYVLAGGLTYSHGPSVFPMLPGDSLLFDAGIPHGIEAVSVFPTKLLAVNSICAFPLPQTLGKEP
jgi:transcriptional regulator with XRE-family HTH domain